MTSQPQILHIMPDLFYLGIRQRSDDQKNQEYLEVYCKAEMTSRSFQMAPIETYIAEVDALVQSNDFSRKLQEAEKFWRSVPLSALSYGDSLFAEFCIHGCSYLRSEQPNYETFPSASLPVKILAERIIHMHPIYSNYVNEKNTAQ